MKYECVSPPLGRYGFRKKVRTNVILTVFYASFQGGGGGGGWKTGLLSKSTQKLTYYHARTAYTEEYIILYLCIRYNGPMEFPTLRLSAFFWTILKKSSAAFYSRVAHTNNNTVTRSRIVSFFTHTVAVPVVTYMIIITTQNRLIVKKFLKKRRRKERTDVLLFGETKCGAHNASTNDRGGISN